MSYTKTESQKTIFGNQRVWQGVITADAESGTVTGFGMSAVKHIDMTLKSASTASRLVADYSGSSVTLAGATSGDDVFITVYGS